MLATASAISGLQIEGNLIASDLTDDMRRGGLKGQKTEEFGFAGSRKLEDEIAIAWGDAKAFWAAFVRGRDRLSSDESGTSLTRDQWVLPLLRSFEYDPFYTAKADVVGGKTYAISHRAGQRQVTVASEQEKRAVHWDGSYDIAGTADLSDKPPLHIISYRLDLEKCPPSGNPRLSAHALMQEYLNRTEHLWGVVTNGLKWRLLRDSSLMTRLAYVEFDLEQILRSENYAEFCLFYRLFHRSRLPRGMDDAEHCLLEFYHQESIQQGGRVRDRLRDGVEHALIQLGNGFLQHSDSQSLRQKFETGEIQQERYYRQLLLLIYRLLFLMVAESRNLLIDETQSAEIAEKSKIYWDTYSIERLRMLAERPNWRRKGFQDLWQGLIVTFKLMDENWRGRLLGLSPLNGDLFGSQSLLDLEACALDNHDLLSAIRHLSLYEEKGLNRRINYAALDVEELGSVYESLLDFHPQVSQERWSFQLVIGSDRKTTGSYYTPRDLVNQLIKTALEPVIRERLKGLTTAQEKEAALLSLTVIDPACGSGHFLLAAARRLGLELARIRTGEPEPGKKVRRRATRDVIGHCIYGVDLNPLAVDLCKVALWVEGFCAGYPLNFLNHRIKCGHSLVGVMDLQVLQDGIPDGAYKAVVGDSKPFVAALKKRNKQERKASGQLSVFENLGTDALLELAAASKRFGSLPENTAEDVHEKKLQQEALADDPQWQRAIAACNLWTAAFFVPMTEEATVPTTADLEVFARRGETVQDGLLAVANQMAEEVQFFHWPLEFPEVFEQGGFDCVLGNPPWERIKLQEKEFFKTWDTEIANAPNKAARQRLINTLPQTKPDVAIAFEKAKHQSESLSRYVRGSDRFALTAVGDVNTYSIFSETARKLISKQGRAGIIVPTGIATDDTCKKFFGDLIKNHAIASLFDFENRDKLFDAVDSRMKFSLLSMSGSPISKARFSFFATQTRHIENLARVFHLTPEDIALINPNTLTCPIFRTRYDAELTKKIYQQVSVLENERTGDNPWGISFLRMLDMSNDSGLFHTEPGGEEEIQTGESDRRRLGTDRLPLYEGKMVQAYDHRAASIVINSNNQHRAAQPSSTMLAEHEDPTFSSRPQYWVDAVEVKARMPQPENWLIGFKSVTSPTNSRTFISSILPFCGVGNSLPIITIGIDNPLLRSCLFANLNSLVFDYAAKQKVGGVNLNFFLIKQLPCLDPQYYSQSDIEFITGRVLELVYTAWDLQPFAQDIGYFGDPFPWDSDRRAILRAELDAYYAHLYGLTRDELRYILDPTDLHGESFPSETFRVLKNKEINTYGEYRTQRLVLEAWDRLFEAATIKSQRFA